MVDTVIDALATYRLVRLVQEDEFPPAAAVRNCVYESDLPEVVKDLYGCPWCLSFWVGLGVAAARRNRMWKPVAFALAASAVTGLISERN